MAFSLGFWGQDTQLPPLPILPGKGLSLLSDDQAIIRQDQSTGSSFVIAIFEASIKDSPRADEPRLCDAPGWVNPACRNLKHNSK